MIDVLTRNHGVTNRPAIKSSYGAGQKNTHLTRI
jgi:hypothetical protein